MVKQRVNFGTDRHTNMRSLLILGFFSLPTLLGRALPLDRNDGVSVDAPYAASVKYARRGTKGCDPNRFWPEQSEDAFGDILDTEKFFGELYLGRVLSLLFIA